MAKRNQLHNGNGKTAIKTAMPSPRSGVSLPLGAHPGNTGGKKGRSGRKPDWLKDFCDEMLATPDTKKAVKAILSDPDHPHFAAMWRAVGDRGHGKPKEHVDVQGDMQVRVIRERQTLAHSDN